MQIKTLYRKPSVMLSIYLLFFGGIYLLCEIFGYTIVPTNLYAGDIISSVFIIWLTVRGFSSKNIKSKASIVFSVLLPLIAFFFFILRGVATDTNTFAYIMHGFITLTCSMILFFSCRCKKVVTIGLGIIYSITLMLIFFVLFILIIFSNFAKNTVEKSELSPNSVYLAEVINNDQGALGGSTIVTVTRQNHDINLLIIKLIKNPELIYTGSWGEFDRMTLTWETDEILYINDYKYIIR